MQKSDILISKSKISGLYDEIPFPSMNDLACELQLSMLPSISKLDLTIKENIQEKLDKFEWKPYNIKNNNNRYFLPIVNYDGKIDSPISLHDLYKKTNTSMKEKDFTSKTPFYYSTSLSELFDSFELGRSFFLKMDPGSYFPIHTDYNFVTRDCFRIVGFFGDISGLTWKQENNIFVPQENSIYYIDVTKPHSTFTYSSNIHMILNIQKTWKNVSTLISFLEGK